MIYHVHFNFLRYLYFHKLATKLADGKFMIFTFMEQFYKMKIKSLLN